MKQVQKLERFLVGWIIERDKPLEPLLDKLCRDSIRKVLERASFITHHLKKCLEENSGYDCAITLSELRREIAKRGIWYIPLAVVTYKIGDDKYLILVTEEDGTALQNNPILVETNVPDQNIFEEVAINVLKSSNPRKYYYTTRQLQEHVKKLI